MKKYFEIIEIVEIDMTQGDVPEPQMVRFEIVDDVEIVDLQTKYEPDFAGKKYRMQIHDHYHGAEGNLSCEIKIIKEVK